ncbi:Nudix hydrolase 18, mitochondrial [Trifolium repens]|nr:nudix hydrolase 18, mitochondrial [Trifolium repens]KAK2440408.1 nudix hydrolase 18, mitochondrial [Trifolium repens]WJX31032.1 Nudix hydrolase 18, mitochondrial [Trifolium repens]WJX36951.1 Nudix hydrolase 18, mitochondrial [Trifolium repens]
MVALVSQENAVTLVSRTGRELQRYRKGRRQVVGCIPYRFKIGEKNSLDVSDELEVLVISSQKGKGMLFPKGGWELDESQKEAALRETIEEAGVRGIVEGKLGKWSFKSKTYDTLYDGYMFPLLVQEQLEFWPEQNLRQRTWMSIKEARDVCQHWWMKEALDRLVNRLMGQKLGRENQILRSLNCIGDAKSDLLIV